MDVKPWDDETDMAALEAAVRSIEQDGLVWGASKLVAIGYGIKKLQITLVVGQYVYQSHSYSRLIVGCQRMKRFRQTSFKKRLPSSMTSSRAPISLLCKVRLYCYQVHLGA